MSLFYIARYRTDPRRYVGLSFIFHAALLLTFWQVLQSEIKIIRTTGVGVEIRTMPNRPRSAPATPQALQPALPQPRRKIGRIVEKRYKLDIPKIQPQAARPTRVDEVQMMRDKKIAKLIRTENVDRIEVQRKDAFKPPAPPNPAVPSTLPAGEYVPAVPQMKPEISVEYVEIELEAAKINLDEIKWKPVEAPKLASADQPPAPAGSPDASPASRRAIKMVKPEAPEDLGIQESKVQVVLRIMIAENGSISKAEIERSSGYLELDNRAMTAVRQWLYEPSDKKDARLVGVTYVIR